MVGLHSAPETAIVLCVNARSQIQALDRTAPILPMQIGLPEKHSHDYVRHGTRTLFAALEIATARSRFSGGHTSSSRSGRVVKPGALVLPQGMVRLRRSGASTTCSTSRR